VIIPRLGLILIFASLTLLGLSHHEMWRDEMQAWLTARDLPDWRNFFAEIRNAGTPPLWHLLLRLTGVLSWRPEMLQALSGGIGILSYALLVRYAPFPFAWKALLGLNFFLLFQYTVVSGPYGLGLLGLILACVWDPQRQTQPRRIGWALAMAAMAGVHSLIVAAGMALVHALDKTNPQRWKIVKIYVAGACLAIGLIQPSADTLFPSSAGWFLRWDVQRLSEALAPVLRSFFACPMLSGSFFESSWLSRIPHFDVVSVFWGSILLGITAALLRRHRTILLGYGTAVAGLVLFFYLRNPGSSPHHGFVFFAFLLMVWLYATREHSSGQDAQLSGPWLGSLLTFSLGVQALGGLIAFTQDLRQPYSHGENAARYIAQSLPESTLIAAGPDYLAASVAGHLQRSFYFPQGRRWGTFVQWDRARMEFFDLTEFTRRSREESVRRGFQKTVLMLNNPPSPSDIASIGLQPLSTFEGSLVGDENFFFYDASLRKAMARDGRLKP